ncbi:DNA alkylation repair protein [Geotalea sp. SG265]|uniref:DNA alkylation repair protein n=1 Tax=Geotalea sp. SG265 TaxID=2922867 RepID=UPI001FAFE180|nr:DNA alkylation repair protein [Geotalea sp. SG265]
MISQLEQRMAELANAEDGIFLQRYFKTGPGQYGEGDIFRGIRVPPLRKLATAYLAMTMGQVALLLSSCYHEDRLLALLILVEKFKRGTDGERQAIYRLYLENTRFINNWDLVDASAEHIVGGYLLGRDCGPLHGLARSGIIWERRIAIMATFHFIRRGKFDKTLEIAEMLLQDREDLIHKAVGWMLREVGKRDLPSEEAFLAAHYRQMPRTMLRYAIERFAEERRQGYLKGML